MNFINSLRKLEEFLLKLEIKEWRKVNIEKNESFKDII